MRTGVFTIWIDHGRGQTDDAYRYAVLPGVPASEAAARAATFGADIVSADERAHLIRAGGKLFAVFFTAGQLSLPDGRILASDRPSVVLLDGERTLAADPTQAGGPWILRLGTGVARFDLPQLDGASHAVSWQ